MKRFSLILALAACGEAPKVKYLGRETETAVPEKLTLTELVHREARIFGLKPEFLHEMLTIESTLRTNAVSEKGAEGIAQLMPETSRKLQVDPYDTEQAVMGAAYWLNVGRRELARNGFPTSRRWLAKWYNCGLPNLLKNKSCGDAHASKFTTL